MIINMHMLDIYKDLDINICFSVVFYLCCPPNQLKLN